MLSSLLDAYRPGIGSFDTAVDPGGAPRPGWAPILEAVSQLGPRELDRRQRAADHLMLAETAGLLLHDAADGRRSDRVAVVPYVLPADDWRELAAGLAQRAEVLQAMVHDLTGPGELLRSGVVPVEAVATHPAYGSVHPRSSPLVMVGADVVVDAGGRFRVRRHRTDVPDGDGRALLARWMVSRVLPRSWPPAELVDHDDYLQAVRSRLAALAPEDRASPRTVVLTGPPDDPGYLEAAALATRLGYNLAEPADVVVRRGRAWLRSMSGLEPIDVVLRRAAAPGLDPMEEPSLAGEGGVAGIRQAERDGGVAVVNPAGTGLGDHLALEPFLDAVSRFLLGQPLALLGVPTLWCGSPDHRAEVTAAPERFVFHDTSPMDPAPPAAGATLDEPEIADWLARIRARPERYVAQVDIPLASSPYWSEGALHPRPVALRTQTLLDEGQTVVLPGGYGRALDPVGPLADERTSHGLDVWVLDPDRRPRQPSPEVRIPQVDLRRSLPTQAAEAMYWTGRTAERAEMGARMVLVCLTRVQAPHEAGPGDRAAFAAALRAVSGGFYGWTTEPNPFDLEDEARAALSGRPAAVVGSLRATTATARRARQLLSGQTWRLLTMLDAEAQALEKLADGPGLAAFDATEVLDRVLVPLAALAGLTSEGVVRGPAYRFFDLGRRLERALLVLGLAEATFDTDSALSASGPSARTGADAAIAGTGAALRLEAVLAACESLVAYRRSFRSDVTIEAVGELMLGDPDNPRSVRFQLDQLAVDLHDLPERPVGRQQLASLRAARRELDRHLPLRPGAATDLVLAVRPHLLDIGQQMNPGWFVERPRWRR